MYKNIKILQTSKLNIRYRTQLMMLPYTQVILIVALCILSIGRFVESFLNSENILLDKDSNFSVINSSRMSTKENLPGVSFSSTNRSIRWFIIDLTNPNNTNMSIIDTSYSAASNNSSNDLSVSLQHNRTYADLCQELYNEDDCMLFHSITTLKNVLHGLDIMGTKPNMIMETSKHMKFFSEAPLQNLTQNFNCVIEEINGLNISCNNVLYFYSIGEYLPNNTVILDISFSSQRTLLAPLFPHLKSLKSLTLSNNHHRFITRAFMGLDNLEKLDLSNNDIMAISKAFSYVPSLKALDLSGNEFKRVKIVSDAVSYLKELQNISLNHNYRITYLTKEDLAGFENCKIEFFLIFNTTIRYIEKGAFSFIRNLKVLDISVNYMNEYALANITCDIAESIETAYFRLLLNVRSFPYDAIFCLRNTGLRALYLGNNHIISVPVLPNLPSLRLFSMPNSSLVIFEDNAFQNVPRLEKINVQSNKLENFPSAFSSLKYLKELFIDSQISDIKFQKFIIPNYAFQNLVYLDTLCLTFLHLENLSRYCLYGLYNLKLALLSYTGLYKIEDYAFETLTSLKMLDLRGNGLTSLNNYTFFGLQNLKQLNLNSNKIKFFSSNYMFHSCPLVNIILFQSNLIRGIPKGMFSNLRELKILSLDKNKIIPWQEKVFHPNASLKILGLSENNIDFISDVMLTEFHQITEYLDLNKNPFNCSKCGMVEFQAFVRSSNLSFHSPLFKTKDSVYVCVHPESMQNKPFFDVELPEISCEDIKFEVLSLIAILIICVFLTTTILVLFICYAFRWYIRYWIFHLKTNFVVKDRNSCGKSYVFDAFIIYCSVDTAWVESHLIPSLEEIEPRYKLCVHERDFQVGKQITENILEAIENSHKVILILTEGFIKSEWCLYELHLAQHKLFDDSRDILILVKLKHIDKKFYTKNISYIEKTRKCCMWTDSHIGQTLFWEQIRKHLGPPRTNQNFSSIAV